MIDETKIQPKARDAIIQSLRAGVVPQFGQKHFQVGRAPGVKALLSDVERTVGGGSGIRFIIGEYGSGKTFFLYLIRAIALEKKLVAAHADLTPYRPNSLYKRAWPCAISRTYAKFIDWIKPDGEALPSIVERFVNSALETAREKSVPPSEVMRNRLNALSEMVGGYDFAAVILAYWKGHDTADEELQTNAVRWLRGEFSTRTDARSAFGVRTIIDDENFYDHLKLFTRFVRLAGFSGLIVCFDELVNLYKMANTKARNSNYEQILRILNDCLQGNAEGLGFLLGGTPDS